MDSLADILRLKILGIPIFLIIALALIVTLLGKKNRQEIDKEIDDYVNEHK